MIWRKGENKMTVGKKILLFFTVGILLFTASCNKEYPAYSPSDPDLPRSVQCYYEIEGEEIVGESFRVKVIGARKSYSETGGVYRYEFDVAFMPITGEPYKIIGFEAYPTDEKAHEYLRKGYKVYGLNADPSLEYGWDNIRKYEGAYYLSVPILDGGEERRQLQEMEAEYFEEAVRESYLVIKYKSGNGRAREDRVILSWDTEWKAGSVSHGYFAQLDHYIDEMLPREQEEDTEMEKEAP